MSSWPLRGGRATAGRGEVLAGKQGLVGGNETLELSLKGKYFKKKAANPNLKGGRFPTGERAELIPREVEWVVPHSSNRKEGGKELLTKGEIGRRLKTHRRGKLEKA